VQGATVRGCYTGVSSSAASGVTGQEGRVVLTSPAKKKEGAWYFCVECVTLPGMTYDPTASVVTCEGVSTA
jgi:hypothetical protein